MIFMALRRARLPAWPLLLALVALGLLLPTGSARALPADAYRVDYLSYPGATSTSVLGVDATGRALGYWSYYFSQPFPRPFGAPPDAEGYFLWDDGMFTPFAISGSATSTSTA